MALIRVAREDFDIAAETRALTAGRPEIGGVASFIGTVRGSVHGRALAEMTLEHYPGMTERAMAAIAAEAGRRWSLLGCTLIHRVGPLVPGDNIVLVLTAATHRQPALEATAFLIDWLKTRAPFWKKERFTDGAEAWVDAREDDELAAARWLTR